MSDTPRAALEAALDPEHASAVLDHRRAIRKPLTAYAAQLLVKEFAKCADPNSAADMMIAKGWQGFRADWAAEPQSIAQRYAPTLLKPEPDIPRSQRVAVGLQKLSAILAAAPSPSDRRFDERRRETGERLAQLRTNWRQTC